ncbi:APA family fibronectin-binding glycoprotein [Dietzia sp. KRD202]|uniref:APA family fibronectin-binding glycoprotein n=1 Tax=Dietzia sp. KRD202 TaxID=2729732 RepID=UPI0019D1B8A9|nr:APA family fibronectin-binding glycoprotein [Dietzia sp. KRD202]
MTSGQNPSAGRSRTILVVALVAVLAVVAAVVTVVVSSATYSPGVRTLSPKIQVAAGSDHVDPYAGLVIRVPEGWRAESGELVFGSTVMSPVAAADDPSRSDGVVLVGQLTEDLFDPENPDNQLAALALVNGMGQFLLPVPGRPVEERIEPLSTRVGDGWSVSFRVLPTVPQDIIGPEGALVYSAVVGEGAQRFWLTYVSRPGDGTMASPHAEWADEIVERLRPSEAYYAPLGPGESTAEPA